MLKLIVHLLYAIDWSLYLHWIPLILDTIIDFQDVDTNVARETIMSQTWQERRLGGKRGKRDGNVARVALTWQERRQRGNIDVIGQYEIVFFNFLYFPTVWTILSTTPQIDRRNFYNMQ